MAEHAEHAGGHFSEEHYKKIWAVLCVLLVVSVLGPMLEIRIVTLITAFGIAVVKAYLVVKNFMHLNLQPRFVAYLLATVLVFVLLFFAGVAPDVMKHEGDQWHKPYREPVASTASHGGGHDEGHAGAGQH